MRRESLSHTPPCESSLRFPARAPARQGNAAYDFTSADATFDRNKVISENNVIDTPHYDQTHTYLSIYKPVWISIRFPI